MDVRWTGSLADRFRVEEFTEITGQEFARIVSVQRTDNLDGFRSPAVEMSVELGDVGADVSERASLFRLRKRTDLKRE